MKAISELISLKGRKAVVTGGAGYIGLAICETLLELGAKVALVDIDQQLCQEKCDELNGGFYDEKAVPIKADLFSEDETRHGISQAAKQLDGIDVLIHCAAFVGTTDFPGWGEDFEKQSLDAWDAALRVNLGSAFVLVQEAMKYLKASAGASVIFISSIYGACGPDMDLYEGTEMKHPGAYGVSKAGLNQLARFFATSFGPQVRFNTIAPGGVWRNQDETFHEKYKRRTPLKRMATEEDLKGAIAYLASDLSSYVTGHNLAVDGGWTAW